MTVRPYFAAAALILLSACARQPVHHDQLLPITTVDYVDVDRYLGLWYEIARFPNRFEKNCEGVTAEYARRDDGKISVVNSCRKGATNGALKVANGRARIVDQSSNAKLKVSFFGPFWGDYWILELDEDYSFAIVGEPSGRYLWILSRTPEVSSERMEAALMKLRTSGYDVSQLYFPDQPPADAK